MKAIHLLGVLLFIFAFSSLSYAQANCPDPGGCSVVSFAAFQNTVGVVQFGNTTGKVYLKKKRILCSGSNCSQFFTMAVALTGPLPASSPATGILLDIPIPQVQLLAQIKELNKNDTRLLGISFDAFVNGTAATDIPSKAKLDSGFPDFKGAGDNGILHIAPGSGERKKFVHQILQGTLFQLQQPSALHCGKPDLPVETIGVQ